jgi:FkbM family methyltransferase
MLRSALDWLRWQLRGRDSWYWMGTHGIALTRAGRKIFLPGGDVGLAASIATTGRWEPHVERVLCRLVKPGQMVAEVGANVGYHTLTLAARVGETGHVHAFEPHPRVLPLLRATLAKNGRLGTRVTLHPVAAAAAAGQVQFAASHSEIGSGHLRLGAAAPPYDEVYAERFAAQAVRLDDALAAVPALDLLRMDVEGAEGLVLEGAAALIARSPALRIVMEWAPAMLAIRSDPAGIAGSLAAQGFRAWRIPRLGRLEPVEMAALPKLPHGELALSRSDLR